MELKIINNTLTEIVKATKKEINNLVIPDGVEVIDVSVFSINKTKWNIYSVTFPKTLKVIKKNAFSGQTKLSHISIPNSIETIENRAFFRIGKCDVVIDGNDDNQEQNTNDLIIGEEAFAQSSITSVKINLPNRNVILNSCSFEECEELSSFELTSSIISLSHNCFLNCYRLKNVIINTENNLVSIPKSCFYGCTNLMNFNFSDLKIIEDYAFYSTGLMSITLPKDIKAVGEWAFGSCEDLEEVNFEADARDVILYESAFQGCTSLQKFDFAPIKEIHSNCFSNDKKLKKAIFGKTNIQPYAFFQAGLEYADLSSAVNVGEYCFAYCHELTTAICPKYGEISKSMFYKCILLEKVTIPDGVTSIGDDAFFNTGLSKIEFPTSLVNIGKRAFQNSSVNAVDFSKCYSLQTIGKEAFTGTDIKEANLINCILSEGIDSAVFDENVRVVLPYYSTV